MTFTQKTEALNALAPFAIRYNAYKQWWYVEQSVEVGGDGFLTGTYGTGNSPEEAVNVHWEILTTLAKRLWLTTGGTCANRRKLRWNGFMWEDVR